MLLISILIICLAHIIRVYRWELLIETYEKPDGVRLTKSLSLGYFLNYFLPFKVGDFIRVLYAGSKMQNGRGFALASIIVERCLDIISVGLIFACLELGNLGGLSENYTTTGTIYYIFIAIVLLIGVVICYFFRKYIKKIILILCSLFNEKYEEKLLRFFWALIWGFKDIISRLPKLKLFLYTCLMWGLYLSSYGAFSTFMESTGGDNSFQSVFYLLFDQKSLLSSGIFNGMAFSSETVWFAMFMLAPLAIIYLCAILWERFMGESSALNPGINLIPQTNAGERRTFLRMYFAGEKKEYIENYLDINRNILVLKDYSAGSNATTILCTDGEKSFYRKYAFQDASEKLAEQITWMEAHEKTLPVAEISRKEVRSGISYYDMPYYSDAVTLFEYAQSGDKEKVWDVIENLLTVLEKKLYKTKRRKNNEEVENTESIDRIIERYIYEKAIKNLDIILEDKSLSQILKYDKLEINGREYNNISAYLGLLSKDNLRSVFSKDKISDIHGDLTIENIVCMKNELDDGELDFYMIDPNTGNILDSKFIDYAKLLQSLHGKYEYLMAVDEVSVNANQIKFKYFEPETYAYLYDKYKEYLHSKLKKNEIRSIYYHEIINWLRLMPYKLKKGTGIQFYAGMIMVLNDIAKMDFDHEKM